MEKLFLKPYRYTHSVTITKILEGEYFSSEGIYSIQEHQFSFIWMATCGNHEQRERSHGKIGYDAGRGHIHTFNINPFTITFRTDKDCFNPFQWSWLQRLNQLQPRTTSHVL